MFKTTKDAINWIESVKKFGDKLDLSRMVIACELLGNPEKNLNVIHIAGTNGKGSTVSYLKNVLLEHNYNVGTFTSPYIVRFNERITYNYNDISDEELLTYINKIYSLCGEVYDKYNEVITFFECVTLISFLYFNDHPCDFVLYEVGLGGRLDATNVVSPIMTAITTINFDHMGVLGDTLESITANKLGIVKPNIPLVTSVEQPELFNQFKQVAKQNNSELTFVSYDDISDIIYNNTLSFVYKQNQYSLKMLGKHQTLNASLAIEILNQLNRLKYINLDYIKLKSGLLKTHWPGRLEKFDEVYLDGAHNLGGANALKESIKILFKGKRIKMLYTTMADKDYVSVLNILEPMVDELYYTQFDYPRCEQAKNILNQTIHLNHAEKNVCENAIDCLNKLKDSLQDNEVLIVTGSLYFISYIRKELFN